MLNVNQNVEGPNTQSLQPLASALAGISSVLPVNNTEIADISRFIPESIISLYQARGAQDLLLKQLAKVNDFIRDPGVQNQISLDFNNRNYTLFDPNFGDMLCESRCFLLEIINKNLPYSELPPTDKMVLTIAHALGQYKIDRRDKFGLIVYEQPNIDGISCGGVLLRDYDLIPIAPLNNIAYRAADLMGQAMSNISVRFLQEVDQLTGGIVAADLVPFQRDNQDNPQKKEPMQVKLVASNYTMQNYMKLMNFDMAVKVTRLDCIKEGKDFVYKLQGSTLLFAPEDRSKAIGVFECFSIKDTRVRSKPLNYACKADTFEKYIDSIVKNDVNTLLLEASVRCDVEFNRARYTSPILQSIKPKAGVTAFHYGNFKQNLGFAQRTGLEGNVFTPCHFYLSTVGVEQAKIDAIPKDFKPSRKVENDQYLVGM